MRARERDLRRVGARAGVVDGDVVGDAGGAGAKLEADVAVLPRGVAAEGEGAPLAVVGEALGRVLESDAVGDDVGGRAGVVAAAELEAVAVALEVGEVPAVDAVAPGNGVLDGDGRAEFPEIVRTVCTADSVGLPEVQAVVDVLPQPGAYQDVARARAFLDADTVGALAVFTRVPVAIRIQIENSVV